MYIWHLFLDERLVLFRLDVLSPKLSSSNSLYFILRESFNNNIIHIINMPTTRGNKRKSVNAFLSSRNENDDIVSSEQQQLKNQPSTIKTKQVSKLRGSNENAKAAPTKQIQLIQPAADFIVSRQITNCSASPSSGTNVTTRDESV